MKYLLSILLLCALVILNIVLGEISVNWSLFIDWNNSEGDWYRWLVLQERLPRTFVALFSGANLALCGVMMQTVFKNPLAGPTTLGINSGAALGVAVMVFAGSSLNFSLSSFSTLSFAFLGAILFLLILLYFHQVFKSVTTLLIVGLLMGYVSYALIEMLVKFSNSEAIKNFVFWGMGSFDRITWEGSLILGICSLIAWFFAYRLFPVFNLMLLGEDELQLMGYHSNKIKLLIFLLVGILIALTTAYVGPLAFVGVAVPNAVKMIGKKSNHVTVFRFSMIWGAILTTGADFITRGVVFPTVLPVNAVLSLLSLPVIILFLLQNKMNGHTH